MALSTDYRAVIFDFNGTLVGSAPAHLYSQRIAQIAACVEAPEEPFVQMWLSLSIRRVLGQFRNAAEQIEYICNELGRPAKPSQLAYAQAIWSDTVEKGIMIRPDAVHTLEQIRSQGFRTGLISDCSPEVPEFWPRTPLAALMDAVTFSCHEGIKKPDPQMYLRTCGQLSVAPEECLYVGDGDSNELNGAVQVGMTALQVKPFLITEGEPRSLGREAWHGACVESLSGVLDYLGLGDQQKSPKVGL